MGTFEDEIKQAEESARQRAEERTQLVDNVRQNMEDAIRIAEGLTSDKEMKLEITALAFQSLSRSREFPPNPPAGLRGSVAGLIPINVSTVLESFGVKKTPCTDPSCEVCIHKGALCPFNIEPGVHTCDKDIACGLCEIAEKWIRQKHIEIGKPALNDSPDRQTLNNNWRANAPIG